LPKPTSIRAMQLIAYVLLAIFLVFIIPSLRVIPESTNLTKTYILLAANFFSLILLIFFIRRRKQFPALIVALVTLIFPLSSIHLVLSFVIILLFFLKSTRTYFRSVNAIEPEPSNELEPAIEQHSNNSEVHIREATPEDADKIHSLMLIAFEEYRSAIPPSTALEEVEQSILEALRDQQESAAILFEDETAAAMIRFKYIDDVIYFFRLSVIPAKRRRGYARQLVKWVEKQGVTKGLNVSRCRVRQSIQNNLVLYQNMGYEVVDQELIVRPAGTVKVLTLEKKLGI
jgi:ribosomal protein S18 acetylase RimI-like enzyme